MEKRDEAPGISDLFLTQPDSLILVVATDIAGRVHYVANSNLYIPFFQISGKVQAPVFSITFNYLYRQLWIEFPGFLARFEDSWLLLIRWSSAPLNHYHLDCNAKQRFNYRRAATPIFSLSASQSLSEKKKRTWHPRDYRSTTQNPLDVIRYPSLGLRKLMRGTPLMVMDHGRHITVIKGQW